MAWVGDWMDGMDSIYHTARRFLLLMWEEGRDGISEYIVLTHDGRHKVCHVISCGFKGLRSRILC